VIAFRILVAKLPVTVRFEAVVLAIVELPDTTKFWELVVDAFVVVA
jgi:hypothetical protein